jgi:hypothetical protein
MNLVDFITTHKILLTTAVVSSTLTAAIIALWMGKAKFKWYVNELIRMYSGEPSFFSKKRIDSGIAFIFALWMTIFYLNKRIDTMDIWSFGYVLTAWLFIAGYTIQHIQSEKKMNIPGAAPADKPADKPAEVG